MNKIAILIALTLYGSINYWLFVRSWQALPATGWIHVLFPVLFVTLSLSFFVAMGLGNKLPVGVTMVVENIGAYWVIGLLYFVLAALFFDLLRFSNHFLKFYPDWVYTHYPQVKLAAFVGVIGLFTVFSLIGNYRFRHPAVHELEVEIPRSEGLTSELTMVMASDVHLGSIIRKGRLKKYVELLNKQKAEVILFAGDLIDHSIRPVEAQRMDEELRELRAPLGVYAIFGNHEYYGEGIRRAEAFYAKSGITLLRDTAMSVANRFVLVGRDDVSQRHRKPLEAILEGAPKGLPTILLDHNPAKMEDAVKNGINLQLSGHTHDGQIFPISLIVRRMYAIAHGYGKSGKTNIYVSSGLGLWAAPIRIGTRSEIVRITLKPV
jgi:predicted MPP superfamily phosphohydrolase